jgi:hypothetical protein
MLIHLGLKWDASDNVITDLSWRLAFAQADSILHGKKGEYSRFNARINAKRSHSDTMNDNNKRK